MELMLIIGDIQETVKIGDQFRVLKSEVSGITTSQESNRIVKQILGADLVETDIYTGLGVDETNNKPVRWEKQKVDIILNGRSWLIKQDHHLNLKFTQL